jgi:hypothetical protein
MKSVQDYIDVYRNIAKNLGITGDSSEVLIQLLSQWSYFNEMELINYVNESSLESSSLVNSKIQHCVDRMYSVFRGTCPRVKLRFIPRKYINLKGYDLLYSSSSFSLYYLGDPISISPSIKSDSYESLTCILAKNLKTSTKSFTESNRYYVDLDDSNLSNDGFIKVNGKITPIYRNFSDHIRYGGIFDLTLPDYGVRLYAPDLFRSSSTIDSMNSEEQLVEPSTTVESNMFEYCTLSDITSGLDKIKVDGFEFPGKSEMLESESYPGITITDGSPRDSVVSTHYKANRDRYTNSIIRSNLDIGAILEEKFPDKIIKGCTSYKFNKSEGNVSLDIYYIPKNENNLITSNDVDEFKSENSSYFVTENINILKGEKCKVRFDINVELYSNESIDESIKSILSEYENKFGIGLESKLGEIESMISKINNVRSVIKIKDSDSGLITSGISFYEVNESGESVDYIPSDIKYCVIEYNVLSTIYRRTLK